MTASNFCFKAAARGHHPNAKGVLDGLATTRDSIKGSRSTPCLLRRLRSHPPSPSSLRARSDMKAISPETSAFNIWEVERYYDDSLRRLPSKSCPDLNGCCQLDISFPALLFCTRCLRLSLAYPVNFELVYSWTAPAYLRQSPGVYRFDATLPATLRRTREHAPIGWLLRYSSLVASSVVSPSLCFVSNILRQPHTERSRKVQQSIYH